MCLVLFTKRVKETVEEREREREHLITGMGKRENGDSGECNVSKKQKTDEFESVYSLCDLEIFSGLYKRFTFEKRKVLDDLCFGWLRKWKCKSLRKRMCDWMLDKFDAENTKLVLKIDGKETEINSLHVQYLLGPRDTGIEIKEDTSEVSDDEEFSKWLKLYGSLSTTEMAAKLRSLSAEDESFSRLLVLFLMTALFAPTADKVPKRSWFHLVKTPTKVIQYNLAKFVYANILAEVREHSLNKDDSRKCGACTLFFLLMIRLEDLKEKHRGVIPQDPYIVLLSKLDLVTTEMTMMRKTHESIVKEVHLLSEKGQACRDTEEEEEEEEDT